MATAFRLVHFKRGSGIATFEPVETPEAEQLDMGRVEAPAIRNLRALVAAVAAGEVDIVVADALDDARKAIGNDGCYGIQLGKRKNGRTTISKQTIERLRATPHKEFPEPAEMTVLGHLHFIEVEEPERVAIRDRKGVDWVCTFDPELESEVFGLVKSIVWAKGTWVQTGPRIGKMHLREIHVVPRHEQSSLFTFERVAHDALEAEQGIVAPQGLAAVDDPDWADDEPDRVYLALILGDDSGS